MKFTLTKEQRHFFQDNNYIEFEGFLSSNQMQALHSAVEEALSPQLLNATIDEQFLGGRDLWRRTDSLKKWACWPSFGQMFYELTQCTPIRLGCDQWLPCCPEEGYGIYHDFISNEVTLEGSCCIKGILGGVLIDLSSDEGNSDDSSAVNLSKLGNVIFFGPKVVWNSPQLQFNSNRRYYLIVYTEQLAWYQLQSGDPLTHQWKRFGYVFNEKLSSALHPIVYR